MNIVSELINHYQSLESVPEEQKEATQRLLLDGLVCLIGGMKHPDILKMKEILPPKFATYIYAAAEHAYDMDDTHDESIVHGNAVILSYLLHSIQQEQKPVSGREFLLRYFIGLDFSNRIGLAIRNDLHPAWLPTNICGVYGGVLTEVVLKKEYSTDDILQLLGYSLSFVGGSRQTLEEVTTYKKFQPGVATLHIQTIVESFMPDILTYPKNFLEGNLGLYAMFQIQNPDNSVFEPTKYQVNNISIKPYPTCRCTHAVIDGAIELRNLMSHQDIRKVNLTLPPKAYAQVARYVDTTSLPTSAQFSASICFAIAFVHGRLTYDLLTEETITEPEITELEQKICYHKGDVKDKGVAPIFIKIINSEGSTIEYVVPVPSGKVTDQSILNKINQKAEGFSVNSLQEIKDMIDTLDSAPDVAQLIHVITQ